MKDLAVQRALNKNTIVDSITNHRTQEKFSVHLSISNEIIITDENDYSKIFALITPEFYRYIKYYDYVIGE